MSVRRDPNIELGEAMRAFQSACGRVWNTVHEFADGSGPPEVARAAQDVLAEVDRRCAK